MSNLDNLFQQAQDEGALTTAGSNVIKLVDFGQQISAGMGVNVDTVKPSSVTLVAILLDDSSSIRSVTGNTEAIRTSVSTITDALAATKQKEGIFVLLSRMNAGLLYPFKPITEVPIIDTSNFNPNGGTPLYDTFAALLATVVAKVQEFAAAGVPARAITLVLTDGADMGSQKIRTPEGIAPLVQDLLRSEVHTLFAMGIDDGATDFKSVFARMGIPSACCLVAGCSPSAIRAAMGMLSQSMVQASQAVPGMKASQTIAGGFGG